MMAGARAMHCGSGLSRYCQRPSHPHWSATFLVFLTLLPWMRYSWSVLRVNLEGLRATRRSAHEVIGKNQRDV